ncbi:MAG: hypothetical protein WAV19_16185, partial [Blautia wexlerae]
PKTEDTFLVKNAFEIKVKWLYNKNKGEWHNESENNSYAACFYKMNLRRNCICMSMKSLLRI